MRLRHLGPDQKKLFWSMAVNIATRVPGLIGVIVMLPVLHDDLGTGQYAFMLGAMALGATVTMLFGGFQTVARRKIGEGYANGDEAAQADGFVTLMGMNGIVMLLALAAIAAWSGFQPGGGAMFVIAAIVVVSAYLNSLDNARSAYNEHYVTAILQIVFQVTNIAVALLVEPIRQNPILASFVLQGHGAMASIVAGTMLLAKRRYLLRGRMVEGWATLRHGLAIGMADGMLSAVLSGSVVWIQTTSPAAVAGWYGTLIRLFQTILVPVALLLQPLSSYIRLIWSAKSPRIQARIIMMTVFLGLGYGAASSAALAVASFLYIDRLLGFAAPGGWLFLLPIFTLFSAIIGYRSYSAIAYIVLDGMRLATTISLALTGALALTGLAATWLPPLDVIVVYALLVALVLFTIELWSALGFARSVQSDG